MSQRDNAACLQSLEQFIEHVLQTPIVEGLISIRDQAAEISSAGGGEPDREAVTAHLLRSVKSWTQILLDEETQRILRSVPYLQKLLTALFVMKVKVLSVINMRKDNSDFPLTIPSNSKFLHMTYIQTSNVILNNNDLNIIDSMQPMELYPLVREGIRKACFACIDWSELLNWGLDGVDINEVVSSMTGGDAGGDSGGAGGEDAGGEDANDRHSEADGDDLPNEFEDLVNEHKVNSEDFAEDAGSQSSGEKDSGDEGAHFLGDDTPPSEGGPGDSAESPPGSSEGGSESGSEIGSEIGSGSGSGSGSGGGSDVGSDVGPDVGPGGGSGGGPSGGIRRVNDQQPSFF